MNVAQLLSKFGDGSVAIAKQILDSCVGDNVIAWYVMHQITGRIYDEYHLFDVYRTPTKANILKAIDGKKDKQLLAYFSALDIATNLVTCGIAITSYTGLITCGYKLITSGNIPQQLIITNVEYIELTK